MREILLTSSVLILALLALRLVFRGRISRRAQYALWALVLLRLLAPVSLPGADFSVLSAAEPVGQAVAERLEAQLAPAPSGETAPPVTVLPDVTENAPAESPEAALPAAGAGAGTLAPAAGGGTPAARRGGGVKAQLPGTRCSGQLLPCDPSGVISASSARRPAERRRSLEPLRAWGDEAVWPADLRG